MAHLQIPNGAMIRLLWTYGSGVVAGVNVMGGAVVGSVTFDQAMANAIGAAIKTGVTSSGLAPLLHASTALQSVGVRDLRQPSLTEFLDSGAAVPGTGAAADALPRQVALCVTLRTALSGAKYRGRVYLGGFSEAENVPGATPSTALQTAAAAFINTVKTALTNNGLSLAVLSRPAERYTLVKTTFHSDGTSDVETVASGDARPGAATPVTLVAVRNGIWDSQRRRTSGGSQSTLLVQPNVVFGDDDKPWGNIPNGYVIDPPKTKSGK